MFDLSTVAPELNTMSPENIELALQELRFAVSYSLSVDFSWLRFLLDYSETLPGGDLEALPEHSEDNGRLCAYFIVTYRARLSSPRDCKLDMVAKTFRHVVTLRQLAGNPVPYTR
jgi:hypothetical protein